MATVPLTVFQMAQKYPTLPPTALSLDLGAGESADVEADGVSFPITGNEIILVQGGAGSQVVTIKSVADSWNRSGDIVYTVGIGLLSVLPQVQPLGFTQSNGTCKIIVDAGGTDVLFWCVRLSQ